MSVALVALVAAATHLEAAAKTGSSTFDVRSDLRRALAAIPPDAVLVTEETLAAALMRIGIATENVSSIGTAEQWVPDVGAARTVLAALRAKP